MLRIIRCGISSRTCSDQELDIGEISRFLGHANPTVTQNIYLHRSDEALHSRAQEVQILNRKMAKKCKILKMTVSVMGGVGLSL